MMSQPFTRERYSGDGKRARLRTLAPTRGEAPPTEWATRTLRTRACAALAQATVMTTSPALIKDDADRAAYRTVERAGAARALRRRLLRLLRARRRLRRSRDRDQSEAA